MRASELLPPAIAEHLSCSQHWQAVLGRHASVVRRLRSGACNSIKHLQLKSDRHVEALSWLPAAQPLLAIRTSPHHADPCSDHLEVLQTSNLQQTPAGLLTHYNIVWHVWISDRQLLCEISDSSGHGLTICDMLTGASLHPLHVVRSLASPDRRNVLVWPAAGPPAIYQLPALTRNYKLAPPARAAIKIGNEAIRLAGIFGAEWSSTGAHIALCWMVHRPSLQAHPHHFVTIYWLENGSISGNFDLSRHLIFGRSLLSLTWSSASDSFLVHGQTKYAAIVKTNGSMQRLGFYLSVRWSSCGHYVHGLHTITWANGLSVIDAQADDDCCVRHGCHLWDASKVKRIFAWQQVHHDVLHIQTFSKRQSIVWARAAPFCFLPHQQMIVVMPTLDLQGSSTCKVFLLTGGDCNPLPTSLFGTALGWTLSASGSLLVNGGQAQRILKSDMPHASQNASGEPLPSTLQQGALDLAAPFCTISEVSGAPELPGLASVGA